MYSFKGSVSRMTGAYKRSSKRAYGSHIWALMSLEALGTEDVRHKEIMGGKKMSTLLTYAIEEHYSQLLPSLTWLITEQQVIFSCTAHSEQIDCTYSVLLIAGHCR